MHKPCTITLLFILSACANYNHAPVSDLERPRRAEQSVHIVNRGESLYSIAWRYGRDFRELAQFNHIKAPYLIKPGQKLSLKKPSITKQQATNFSIRTPSRKAAKNKTKDSNAKSTAAAVPLSWQWPAKGRWQKGYINPQAKQAGLEIVGKRGSPITAAADGVVVYAGNGLVGYGNLMIIKHSDLFLSAYAHNQKLLVSEQKKVKAGEKIAEMGSTGTGNTKLYFEIRRNGQPVDPINYLPKSGL